MVLYQKVNGALVKVNSDFKAEVKPAPSGSGSVLVIEGPGYTSGGGHYQMSEKEAKDYARKINDGWDPTKNFN
ncbi:MAG: hypothetical protein KAV87_57815 [Desulfobacteraceae bacterium]|nr:hypothetical protein [Desulfobacteraceae bacterium]